MAICTQTTMTPTITNRARLGPRPMVKATGPIFTIDTVIGAIIHEPLRRAQLRGELALRARNEV